MSTHWQDRAKNWGKVANPPKRPVQSVIDQVRNLVGDRGKTLVLGVTPQLVSAFTDVHAVDRELGMIEALWQGYPDTKTVECLDWFDIPGEDRYSAIVGDGSLNMVSWPYGCQILLEKMHQLLIPGGKLACRVFTCPDRPFNIEDLDHLASSKPSMGFDAWRSRLSHVLAQMMGPNIPVREMLRAFNYHWPDRQVLCENNRWDPDTISKIMDAYSKSDLWTSFPTVSQWLSVIPADACDSMLIPTHGYELAEDFPILTFKKALR
jgi:hypothetical protein